MFLSFKGKIGNIIIKDHSIRYVELKQSLPNVLQKCEERLLPPGLIKDGKIENAETLAMILDECVSDWGIKGRKVRFTVPDSHVVIRKVTVPADLKPDELRGHLYLEIGSSIHLPFEEVVFDYVVLKQNAKGQDLLLFASSEELVTEYSNLFEDAHLKPITADISTLCYFRLFKQQQLIQNNKTTLFIQFDLFSENLSIFQDQNPVFMKNRSNEDSDEDSKETFSLRLNDVIKEIDHVINFYKFTLNNGTDEVKQFILSGDHPLITTVYEELKGNLNENVQLIPEEVGYLPDKTPIPRTFHLATGLALKEVH
ncbi:type IV pilus biogenesis protein PilM [Metabacillus herbersteinensis]|uniref:Type IV pilus biogenesis protein PilM n=1 Tax=Metabacillus herbersteinensis TaxID=283816 RepID=A0ABV6G910_9BACI